VTETTVRDKTVTWDDPMETALAGRGQAGLDFLRSMIAGEVPGPPIASLLGMALVEVDHGRAVFTLTDPTFARERSAHRSMLGRAITIAYTP